MADYINKKNGRFSESLRDAPKSSLKKENCCCVMLFITLLASLFGYTCFKASHSELNKLTLPFDPDVQACGFGDRQEYPFIYFVRPDINYIHQYNVCVKSCPKTNSSTETIECKTNTFVKDCKLDDQSKIYATREEFGKICMPIDEDLYNKVSQALQISSIEQAILTVEKENSSIVLFTSISIICTLILLGFSFFKWNPFNLYGSPAITTLGMLAITAFSVLFFYISLSEDTSDEPWSQEAKQDPESFYRKRLIRENGDYTLHLLIGILFGIWTLYNFFEMSSIYSHNKDQLKELRDDCCEASKIVGKRGIILLVLLVLPFAIGTLFGILEIEKNIFAIPMDDEAKQLFLYPFNKYFQAFESIILNIICIIPACSWILTFFCTFVEYVTAIQTFRYSEIKSYYEGRQFSDNIRTYQKVSAKRSVVKQLFQDIKDVFFTQLGSIVYYSFFQCFSLIASFHNDLVEPFYQQFNQPSYTSEVQQSQLRLNSNPTKENESDQDKNTEQMLPPTPTLEDTKLYLAVFVNHFQKIYGQQDLYQLEEQISYHKCYKKLSFAPFFESVLRATLSLIPAFLYYFSKMNDDESSQSVGKDSNDLDKKQAPLLLVWGASYVIASIGTTVYRASFQYLITYDILIEGLLEKQVQNDKLRSSPDTSPVTRIVSQNSSNSPMNDNLGVNQRKIKRMRSNLSSSSNGILSLVPSHSSNQLIKEPESELQQFFVDTEDKEKYNTRRIEEKIDQDIIPPLTSKQLRELELQHAKLIRSKLFQEKQSKQFADQLKNNSSNTNGISGEMETFLFPTIKQISDYNGRPATSQQAFKANMINHFKSIGKTKEQIDALLLKSDEVEKELIKTINQSNDDLSCLPQIGQLILYQLNKQLGHRVHLDNTSNTSQNKNDPIHQFQEKELLTNPKGSIYFEFSAALDSKFTLTDETKISLELLKSLSTFLDIKQEYISILEFKFESDTRRVYAIYTVNEALIELVKQKNKEIGNGNALQHFIDANTTLNSLLSEFQISPALFNLNNGGIKIFPETQTDEKKYRGKLQYLYHDYSNWKQQEYKVPYGWIGLNLKVDQFGDEPKGWFGKDTHLSTFIVLYHGTSGKYVSKILSSSIRAGKVNAYADEICRLTRKPIDSDSNLYMADDIVATIQYTDPEGYLIGNKRYQFVFQCRVNPEHVRSPESNPVYYTIQSQFTEDSVRPYRLLIREVTQGFMNEDV